MRPAVCPIIRLCPVLLYKNSYNKAICDFMLASRGKNKPPRRVHDRTLVPRSSSSPTFSTCILDNDVLPSSSINHWSQAAEDCSSLTLLRSRLRPYVGDGGGWWWLKVKSVFSFRTPFSRKWRNCVVFYRLHCSCFVHILPHTGPCPAAGEIRTQGTRNQSGSDRALALVLYLIFKIFSMH